LPIQSGHLEADPKITGSSPVMTKVRVIALVGLKPGHNGERTPGVAPITL
jgi:hypothetical protein